ncbi:cell cycle progression protein 1 [Synchiropus splendidus]|uniref:cell cycle progression protein 1 n=1 Tax=Synchiropus splendidus TaxID=270530 RepID=UPI00237E3785|nr:cell cycle progression protein 1 [Synchiropus splendidus]XP_053720473.1 cell cycle progression protein 1 [Synchiropus splendidus]XP_053720474.1 cell cycle progression protein 1 [Synchiropus splendidus]XP_053720476.1 cell cycle progression protein 1 [Synchiropus splendidus]XP_053720477.1 cell cycle progression protein 1 [Synchiropus splendidus]XP_053720478.1 cell cycle progression protein 1 [Synchiropus splendidus]XP_053720479.1 cell cycle progression protein 1 [Synchiropus splendidus]XP_0
MSTQQSDTDSSFGWTIISNKGSDIETAPEHEEVQQEDGVMNDGSLDETVEDRTILETLGASELVGTPEPADAELLSFSDHSDIVSLDGLKESRNAEDDNDYFGAACSSQYAFTLPKTVEPSTVAHTSSSEEQAEKSSTSVLRRRRTRRNTASTIGREEETDEDGSLAPAAAADLNELSLTNSRLLPILLVVVGMTVYCVLAPFLAGNVKLQENPAKASGLELDKLQEIWELLQTHMTFRDLQQLDDQRVFSLLVKVLLKVHKENQDFQALQAKKVALDDALMKRESQERTNILLEQQRASLSAMQQELKSLHLKIQHSPMKDVVSRLQSENKRLKLRQVRQEQSRRSWDAWREELLAEVQTLRSKLLSVERVRDVLKQKIVGLKTKKMEKENESQELRSQLAAVEKKLNFEQQRSDMWERLYVEATAREKGDTDSEWEKSEGMGEKLKKTYEKAKEAVKANLRRFKDSIVRGFYNRNCKKPDGVFCPWPNYHNTRKPSDTFDPFRGFGASTPVRAEEFNLLLQNYLRHVGLSHNWTELKMFVSKFFRNGFFIHDQMPFREFISRVKSRLAHMNGFDSNQFEDLDLYVNLI